MIDDRTYLKQLERSLRRRGLDASRTSEVIAELADHLAQSGEAALAAFGEPDAYALALLAADELLAAAGTAYEARTFRATARDELEILADIGGDGWELTGVRDFGLHARRPREPEARRRWEYARLTGLRRGPVVAEMTPAWIPCGRWLTFHYFKRAL
ncbi:MAG TPA: hypothetical protein VGO80_24050 [Solirubrobacteraceae bacterium]|jgi:hypothetical protein|nr:hypothetical protein [Solirubrobacteraceae bacterium]